MKKLIILAFAFFTLHTSAQITIVSSDLPVNGTISVLTTATPFTGMNVAATGANYTWDFSQLQSTGQQVDTFFSESAGNPLLSLYFSNTPFNPNRSNHSAPGPDLTLGTIAVSNVFNYYYNSTSEYRQTGFGAEVNGVPLPITFSPHDRIYQLPMTYNQRDSVTFQYGVDLTSTLGIYYNVRKTRRNFVDGWGTLITPFQTFNCLRVQTRIVEVDSIYIDSLGFGFATPPITTNEYKWLATGQRVPVLQINTTGAGAVTSILYKDALVSVPEQSDSKDVSVFPNPAVNQINVKLNGYRNGVIQLFSLTGALVYESAFMANSGSDVITIPVAGFSEGTYVLKLADANGKTQLRQVVVGR